MTGAPVFVERLRLASSSSHEDKMKEVHQGFCLNLKHFGLPVS